MGTIYYPDGKVEQRAPANGRDFQLDELHAIVGGWLEMIPLHDGTGRIMVVNEDGKNLGLPLNQIATTLADLPTPAQKYKVVAKMRAAGLKVAILGNMEESDQIVGTVIVCEKGEVE